MLYSEVGQFLFIHIQKTAGTSLHTLLVERVPDAAQHEIARTRHASAMWAMEALGEDAFKRLFRFAFVRNPYDRLLSWYAMIEQTPLERCTHLQRSVRLNCAGFEQFVLRGPMLVAPELTVPLMQNQIDFISDRRGRSLVNFVGRFERLAEDAAVVLGRIGIRAELPHDNASTHAHYRDAYSVKMRATVRWRFRRDFDAFKYRF
jgi:hypothetical protein